MVSFFFLDDVAMDIASFDKVIVSDPKGQAMLIESLERFASVVWKSSELHAAIQEIGESLSLNLRKAQAPIRCAVTGSLVGPPLFESLELLGRDKVRARISGALARCSG